MLSVRPWATGAMSEWRNRQTRQLEGLVPVRVWGFKSPLRHAKSRTCFWAEPDLSERHRQRGSAADLHPQRLFARDARDQGGAQRTRACRPEGQCDVAARVLREKGGTHGRRRDALPHHRRDLVQDLLPKLERWTLEIDVDQ